jgi:hypothetical protein
MCNYALVHISYQYQSTILKPAVHRESIHCKDKIPKCQKQIFPEKEYQGLSPNFHIHASVSDLYISTIALPIVLEEICRQILGLHKSLIDT